MGDIKETIKNNAYLKVVIARCAENIFREDMKKERFSVNDAERIYIKEHSLEKKWK